MPKLSFEGMVKDPFSFFNIISIFIISGTISSIIFIPLTLWLSNLPAASSFFEDADTFYEIIISPLSIAIFLIIYNVILMLIIYLRVIKYGSYKFSDIGIYIPENLVKPVVVGIFFSFMLIIFISMISTIIAMSGYEYEPYFGIPQSQTEFIILLIAAGVFAPIGEEMYFRAYIVTALKARYNPYFAITFSAIFFAAMHFDIVAFIPLLIAGLFIAYIFHIRKDVIPCIIIHALNNCTALMFLYFAGS